MGREEDDTKPVRSIRPDWVTLKEVKKRRDAWHRASLEVQSAILTPVEGTDFRTWGSRIHEACDNFAHATDRLADIMACYVATED